MKRKSPKFTEEQELQICKEYEEGTSTIELATKYGCATWGKIHSMLKRHGKVCRDRCHQSTEYEIDEHFFDTIDTEQKAYFLGLLYADGGNTEKSILLALKRDDSPLLQKLNSLFQNKPIRHYATKTTEYSRIEIANRYMIGRLAECGIVPRKSLILKFPSENIIPKILYNHFIRGYYDGDGSLVINYKQIGGKGAWNIISTKEFLYEVKKIINEQTGANTQIVEIPTLKPENKSTKRLVSCGNNQILKILSWLYDGASIYLDRKYQKYKELTAIQRGR